MIDAGRVLAHGAGMRGMSPARIRTAAWLCAASLALAAPGCREAAPGAGEAEETVTRRPIAVTMCSGEAS